MSKLHTTLLAVDSPSTVTRLLRKAKALLFIAMMGLFVCLSLALSHAGEPEHTIPSTIEGTEITLVHSRDYPPLFYLDEKGQSTGILVDYWRLWSQKTGVSIRFEPLLWHQCIERGKTDDRVIIPGIFYSPDRDAFLDFSAAFFDVKTSLFLRETIDITVVEDLKGRIVGVTKGDRAATFLENDMPYLKLQFYDGFKDVMQAAANGSIDVFAMDSLCAQYFLHKYDVLDHFTAFETLYVGKFCAGVKEGNHKLLRVINDGIEKIRQEEIDSILGKWLVSAELVPKQILNTIIVIAFFLVFIIIMASVVILKIQVRNQTRELQVANRELQESQERFRRINETFSVGLIIHIDGIIQEANIVTANMVGYTIAELIGMNGLDLFLPEWQEHVLSKIKSDNVEPYEAFMLRKDGTTFPVEIQGKLMPYKGQMAMVVESRDISDRKRAEEEKRELEARLQRMEKMEALGTLAGGVAHDLNNILSGLVSYPELLLLDLPANSRFKKPIETIQKSGQKAAAIVQDLLNLARRGLSVMEVLNLNQIITDYLTSPEFKKLNSFHPNIQITSHLDPDLLNISGSPVHLSKTLMNIVLNAAEATPDGGLITITTQNKYIDTPIRSYDIMAEGDYAVLTITDTGTGISLSDQERIFEPFYTKKKMGRSGTGLGMAVVWGTVKDHHGYIDIDSSEGKGTSFMLYFPATRSALSKEDAMPSMDRIIGNGEHILVVDDVEEQRDIATQLLTRLGYKVRSLSSGEKAVDYLKTKSVDLLILDMIMSPGIDGLETYRQIRQYRPGQKAIITSGFSETERVREALQLGVGQYVKKPYSLDQLGVAVRKELAISKV
jgi:PAS domain S-box-containing protein